LMSKLPGQSRHSLPDRFRQSRAKMYGPAARCKTDFRERRTWELHQCIRSLRGASFAPDHHGYPRASRL